MPDDAQNAVVLARSRMLCPDRKLRLLICRAKKITKNSAQRSKDPYYDSCNCSWFPLFVLALLCLNMQITVCRIEETIGGNLLGSRPVIGCWVVTKAKGAGDSGSISRHVHLVLNQHVKKNYYNMCITALVWLFYILALFY